ncbi:MAG: hypothetical protein GU361_00255 [Desulfurococcales archaeon]|jgi:hypothetical protein|nr:hypothetical protein [Desulfurococcales archaeon]
MSEQIAESLQTLKAIDELIDKYLSEGSVEKAVSLCYIVEHGFDAACRYILLKFSSLKPCLEVIEDLKKAGVSSIPGDAKRLVEAKRLILRQYLIRDALDIIDKLDPLVKNIVAIALLMFENIRDLSQNIAEEIFRLYQILIGEILPNAVKEELCRYLYRLHILDPYFNRLSPDAPYILKALKDKVPRIIIEFEEFKSEPGKEEIA